MSEGDPLILLIEDEPQMRRFLRVSLTGNGFRLVESETGEDGLRQAATRNPDVVLLDLGLPDLDGMEVTRRLREWSKTPIIVISARGQERDKVDALDAGADDYLTKPFVVPELLARIRVALRHREQAERPEPVFHAGDLTVDFHQRQVFAFFFCEQFHLRRASPLRLEPITCRATPIPARRHARLGVVIPVCARFFKRPAQNRLLNRLNRNFLLARRRHLWRPCSKHLRS